MVNAALVYFAAVMPSAVDAVDVFVDAAVDVDAAVAVVSGAFAVDVVDALAVGHDFERDEIYAVAQISFALDRLPHRKIRKALNNKSDPPFVCCFEGKTKYRK